MNDRDHRHMSMLAEIGSLVEALRRDIETTADGSAGHDHGEDACPADIYLDDLADCTQVVAEYLVGKIDAKYGMEQVRQIVEDYAEPVTPELREALGADEPKPPCVCPDSEAHRWECPHHSRFRVSAPGPGNVKRNALEPGESSNRQPEYADLATPTGPECDPPAPDAGAEFDTQGDFVCVSCGRKNVHALNCPNRPGVDVTTTAQRKRDQEASDLLELARVGQLLGGNDGRLCRWAVDRISRCAVEHGTGVSAGPDRQVLSVEDDGVEATLGRDFYQDPNREWVYKWADERYVIVDADELRVLRSGVSQTPATCEPGDHAWEVTPTGLGPCAFCGIRPTVKATEGNDG